MISFFRYLLIWFIPITFFNPIIAQWVHPSNALDGMYISSLATSGTSILVTANGGVLRSTDSGVNWTKLQLYGQVNSLFVSNTNLFAATTVGINRTTDGGVSWSASTGLPGETYTIDGTETNLFAGTREYGVYRSTNNGLNWFPTNLSYKSTHALAIIGDNIFAGTAFSGVFRSTDNGANWNPVNTGIKISAVWAMAVLGTNLFVSTIDSCVYLSTNLGTNWTSSNTGLTKQNILSFASSGKHLFAGTYRSGVLLSTDYGASWSSVNTGLPSSTIVRALVVSGANLFAGPDSGVWWRQLSEMVTSVENTSTSPPLNFSLGQNYPNPFNPSTSIRFGVPDRSILRLTVYNMLGQPVAVLVNKEVSAGYHEVTWNANAASGIYFYRIETTSNENPSKQFLETKKMLLLK